MGKVFYVIEQGEELFSSTPHETSDIVHAYIDRKNNGDEVVMKHHGGYDTSLFRHVGIVTLIWEQTGAISAILKNGTAEFLGMMGKDLKQTYKVTKYEIPDKQDISDDSDDSDDSEDSDDSDESGESGSSSNFSFGGKSKSQKKKEEERKKKEKKKSKKKSKGPLLWRIVKWIFKTLLKMIGLGILFSLSEADQDNS